jgi:hypothetical protein
VYPPGAIDLGFDRYRTICDWTMGLGQHMVAMRRELVSAIQIAVKKHSHGQRGVTLSEPGPIPANITALLADGRIGRRLPAQAASVWERPKLRNMPD